MNRAVYTGFLIVAALLVGFLLLLISGGYILEGEAAMGMGILWYYSLPAFLLLGYLVGRSTHGWYSTQSAVYNQLAILLGLAFAVAVLSPLVTYGALYVLSLG